MLRAPLILILVLTVATGCSREPQSTKASNELRILCGSSMAAPGQAIADLFRTNQPVEVVLDLGGSETLLPKVLAGAPADIFICHDPFEQKLKDSGDWAGSAAVGVLEPVLLVRRGNPQRIQSLADLTRPNLKVGIGDPRYSTCGELFVRRLEEKGIREQVMKQVVLQGRTHAEIANGLILGPLDVVVVWNFVARLYQDKVQLVPTPESYPRIQVTVVGLRRSPNPKQRDAFLELCHAPQVKAIFAENGYVSSR
jgi:molybdate transport system substrate-binding protein